MARGRDRSVRFGGMGQYTLNMMLFLLGVGAVIFYLSPLSPQPSQLLVDAFNANVALNGLILGVLLIGIVYNLRQVFAISDAVRWAEGIVRGRARRAPGIISAADRQIAREDQTLTVAERTAILDSVSLRMDESRDMGGFIGNLLVFLALLGTFWGLLQTVNAVGATIAGLASTSGPAEEAVAQLIRNLQEPLGGMGTAFSSSLFGLGGSLVVGFLDLQASQAQGRFYSDFEDWLVGFPAPARSDGLGASYASNPDDLAALLTELRSSLTSNTDAQIKASAEQIADLKDEIRALNRTLIRVGSGE